MHGPDIQTELSLFQSPPLHVPSDILPPQEFAAQPATELEETFRHSGWAARRQQVADAFVRCRLPPARIDRFACCGANCMVEYSQGQQRYRIRGSYCHDRLCVPCARARGMRAATAIRLCMKDCADLKFVTFTLKHLLNDSLSELIDRLRNAFALLRHRPVWKDNVTAGAVVLEVKRTKDGWHPHLHCLVRSGFIPQAELQRVWLQCTGDSFIVDIRDADPVRANEELTSYLVKYVSKPAGDDVFREQHLLDEFIIAMKGQRVVNFLGDWRSCEKSLEERDEHLVDDWVPVGSLHGWLVRRMNGDPIAECLLAIIRKGTRSVASPRGIAVSLYGLPPGVDS